MQQFGVYEQREIRELPDLSESTIAARKQVKA